MRTAASERLLSESVLPYPCSIKDMVEPTLLKVHLCKFINLTIWSFSYKSDSLKLSHY